MRQLAGEGKSPSKAVSDQVSLLALALIFTVGFPGLPVFSGEYRAINPNEAVNKIREAKIINPQCSVKVAFTGKEEATVVIQRDPKASDEDCKIDAVLVARTLMDKYPNQLMRVKSVFTKSPGECGQATVTAGDIRSFRNGQLDKRSLLDSIELVHLGPLEAMKAVSSADPGATAGVVPGPLQPWRLLTLEHINKLAALGVNVRTCLDEFNQIEGLVPTSQQKELRRRLVRLNGQLREQDEMTVEAKQTRFALFGNRRKPMVMITERLQEMASQGKDVSPYTDKVKEIERLKSDGRTQEAKRLMNELSQSLGI
ncbi:MAG: hypothetical protein C5B53_02980 [Candidatus Melainabacteria bacterium]|nr:MAG: hypothetical protein C5B53_02980 [Candidatus Melainabacteria bacterium]